MPQHPSPLALVPWWKKSHHRLRFFCKRQEPIGGNFAVAVCREKWSAGGCGGRTRFIFLTSALAVLNGQNAPPHIVHAYSSSRARDRHPGCETFALRSFVFPSPHMLCHPPLFLSPVCREVTVDYLYWSASLIHVLLSQEQGVILGTGVTNSWSILTTIARLYSLQKPALSPEENLL